MKKILALTAVFFLFLGICSPVSTASAASDACAKYKGVKKIIWNGMELKPGQIGKLIVLKDTPLFKLDGERKVNSRTLKKGEFYRIYAFKPGMLGLGGGYFVNRDTKVKYETPSQEKLLAVQCITGKVPSTGKTPSTGNTTPKILTTKEIVNLNDDKVVLIETNRGQGSGVVIAKGLILTNYHVMKNAQEATATFNSGDVYQIAGMVDFDAKKDIAIIKTSERFPITSVTFKETSTDLAKGDKVVAIGNPQGLQNTVSEGIISSFRTLDGVKLIQTNADIDHGSSGGGLFNTTGQLIGITTAGFDDTSANLNFALAPEVYMPMVKKYSALSWINLQASFPAIPPIFGNVKLGMSKQEVKAVAAGTFDEEKDNFISYKGLTIFDYPAVVVYQFENDKLVTMAVYHDYIDYDTTYDDLEEYYGEMFENLSYMYGSPTDVDLNWNDDGDKFKGIGAVWKTSEYNVILGVYVSKEDSFTAIMITSKSVD